MTHAFTLMESIQVGPDRQRQAFDEGRQFELTEDIKSLGLLQPIILSGKDLLAGERRLRSVRELFELGISITFMGEKVPLGFIPTLQLADASELTRMQIEYSENEFRDPITWQERAKAQAALASLRHAQDSAAGVIPRDIDEIVKEALGKTEVTADQRASVRTNINVSRYLNDPDVAKAGTAKEAAKIIKRKEQTANNTLAAQAFQAAIKSGAKAVSMHEVHQGDCLVYLEGYAGRPIDLILSDPPYGINADTFGDGATNVKGQHQYDDSFTTWEITLRKFAIHSYRVTAPAAAMYLFCDFDRFHALKQFCEDAGWYVHRTPLIWSKQKNGLVPIPSQSHARSYELILFASKGGFELQHTRRDVIEAPADENLGHGAQKPVKLYQELIERTVPKGSLVADFFAGSGPIIPAAHAHACRSIAVEGDIAHFGIITSRLENLNVALI